MTWNLQQDLCSSGYILLLLGGGERIRTFFQQSSQSTWAHRYSDSRFRPVKVCLVISNRPVSNFSFYLELYKNKSKNLIWTSKFKFSFHNQFDFRFSFSIPHAIRNKIFNWNIVESDIKYHNSYWTL